MPQSPAEWMAAMDQAMVEQRTTWDSQDKVMISDTTGLDEHGLLASFDPGYNPYFISTDVSIENIADGDIAILQKTYTAEDTAAATDFKHYFPVDGEEDSAPQVSAFETLVDDDDVEYGVRTRINYSIAEKQNLRDRLGYSPDFNVGNHIENVISAIAQDVISTNVADRFACRQILQSGYKSANLAAFTTTEGPQASGVEFVTTTTQVDPNTAQTRTDITKTTEMTATTFGVMRTQSETGY